MRDILERGLEELGLSEYSRVVEPLLLYLELLQRWNKAYNLTSVRDPHQMVVRHLLDSLAIAPVVADLDGSCLDVGTGAGLPGVPLALLFPERSFTLLDSNGKKTRFLFQVKTELGLANMLVCNQRVETLERDTGFPVIVSRAFSELATMVDQCRHLLTDDGSFLAMKGIFPSNEVAALPDDVALVKQHEIKVPGLDEARHLLELKKC